MVVEERVEDLEATLALLEALIGLTVEEREAFQGRLARRRRPLEPVTLRLRLDPQAMARVAVNRHRLRGWKSKQDCCVITLMGSFLPMP